MSLESVNILLAHLPIQIGVNLRHLIPLKIMVLELEVQGAEYKQDMYLVEMEEQHKQQFVIKRKKMKKTLMIVLLSITSANANLFVSLGYATSPNTQTVEDENGKNMKFDDISHFKLNIGDVIFTNEERGKGSNSMYLGLGGASVSKSEDSLEYTSTLLNLGMTHTFNNNIAVFGGIGLEYQKIANQNEDVASNHKLNGNIGVMAYLLETSIGIIVEYDSAPNLVSAGLAWRF